ncbi:DUF4236 domain-containing protein [Rhizobium sp. 2YAF20]|uniref:DUF4236 domain-containing protein n=1 Tax=Rhizobium sp. 2YAF20 TaxID=3233027 RepID=UPI003F985445
MEERSGQWVLKSQGKTTGEPGAGVPWWPALTAVNFRKSVKAGPFRFHFSKGGAGVSVGVRGLRMGTDPFRGRSAS